MAESGKPSDRRDFFREGLAKALKPVAEYLETAFNIESPRRYLRPPGAVSEKKFLETCYRNGNCVEACAAGAIKPLKVDDEALSGTPVIDPDLAPCVVCDDLSCTKACPSEALQLVQYPQTISMGIARVNSKTCLRSDGEDCRVCVERCPIGPIAVSIGGAGEVNVLDPGCIGCGVCQFHCPTSPKSIVIEPR